MEPRRSNGGIQSGAESAGRVSGDRKAPPLPRGPPRAYFPPSRTPRPVAGPSKARVDGTVPSRGERGAPGVLAGPATVLDVVPAPRSAPLLGQPAPRSAASRSVIHPTRLETRTKESNMCASHWAN